jgi:hypothetical protein
MPPQNPVGGDDRGDVAQARPADVAHHRSAAVPTQLSSEDSNSLRSHTCRPAGWKLYRASVNYPTAEGEGVWRGGTAIRPAGRRRLQTHSYHLEFSGSKLCSPQVANLMKARAYDDSYELYRHHYTEQSRGRVAVSINLRGVSYRPISVAHDLKPVRF